MTDGFASPVVIFAIAVTIGYGLYAFSRVVAPRPAAAGAGDKTMPYVGGEAYSAQAFEPGYQFFYVALFFALVHMAALVLATAPPGVFPIAALAYLGLVAVGVIALRWES